MHKIALALAVALSIGAAVPAMAQVGIHVGPGGVYVGPHRHYDYYGGCRTVITHHFNRWGNEVTVRHRTCD